MSGHQRRVDRPPFLIPADNPGPYTGTGNNTWLVDGAEPALIDSGTGVSSHVEAIAAVLGGRTLARVLLTHGHLDHASGVPALQQRWPSVAIFKHGPDPESAWNALRDGQVVRAGDRDLSVIYTPGHAVDHVTFWDPDRREAYTGDMVIRPGSVLIPAGRGGSLRDYLASLARIAALSPTRLFPGHGPIIDNPLAVIDEYVAHRHMRETQILACLAEGVTDVDAVVARLYAGLPESLREAARLTVQAHLDKIRDDAK